MEGMDADCYVLEYMIRDRRTNARARARVVALLADRSDAQELDVVEPRFTDPGRRCVKGVRKLVGEIAHTVAGWTRNAKHS